MRFKTDENVHAGVAALLRDAGHDAATAREETLGGRPDPDLARACLRERRVLVTQDLDFADVRVYPPGRYVGIVVLRLSSQDGASQIAALKSVLPLLSMEPIEGRLWIVDERRVRIRGETRPGP